MKNTMSYINIEQVRSFGQCCDQIFKTPHPQKEVLGFKNKNTPYNVVYSCYDKLYQLSAQVFFICFCFYLRFVRCEFQML